MQSARHAASRRHKKQLSCRLLPVTPPHNPPSRLPFRTLHHPGLGSPAPAHYRELQLFLALTTKRLHLSCSCCSFASSSPLTSTRLWLDLTLACGRQPHYARRSPQPSCTLALGEPRGRLNAAAFGQLAGSVGIKNVQPALVTQSAAIWETRLYVLCCWGLFGRGGETPLRQTKQCCLALFLQPLANK